MSCLCLFPYHLADIVTKGLRVTPFNYYRDVICLLLKNDKSYDTLPNFTAADCKYTVLLIGSAHQFIIVTRLNCRSSCAGHRPQ